MKAPAQYKVLFEKSEVSEATKVELLRDTNPRFARVTLENPIQQDGHDFAFAVVPAKFTPENKFVQCGRAVLCQTQAEADETVQLLTAAAREDMGIFQAGNLGVVAFGKNLRCIITEYSSRKMTLPGGKKAWMAIEREIDKATGGFTVKRKQPARNESEATRIAQQWQAEYDAKKNQYFDAVANSKALPPAAPRCEPLTETDSGDLEKVKMEVLRRQWKHCFALFDKRNAGCHFSEDDCRKAYLLDFAEQGDNPLSVKLPAGTDKEFFTALTKAWNRASRGKNKLLLQLVDYLIAFNWKLGWCYLSEKELAEKISASTKAIFTPGQIGKRRERLGLVAKHQPGPPFKFSP